MGVSIQVIALIFALQIPLVSKDLEMETSFLYLIKPLEPSVGSNEVGLLVGL